MATTLNLAVLLLILPRLLVTPASAQLQQQQQPLPVARPGCRDRCGNITVPYPFGIGASCFRDDGVGGFQLQCDDSSSPPRLTVYGYNHRLAALSLAAGEARDYLNATRACYNSTGGFVSGSSMTMPLISSTFLFSAVKNRLVALGCPNLGYFVDGPGYYVSGCMSGCRPSQYAIPGLCTGVGCCQSAIPTGVNYFEPHQRNFPQGQGDSDFVSEVTACHYVFLVEAEWFRYSDREYLNRTDDFDVPVVLDWAVRNVGNCSAARRNATDYACRSARSECVDSSNGAGYRCNCSKGYEGNPYLDGGCRDIDECALPESNKCFGECINTPGSYVCRCPRGARGDPRTRDGCVKSSLGLTVGIGVVSGAGLLFLVLGTSFVTRKVKHRRAKKLKQKFFKQNRGHLLQQLVSQRADIAERMIIPLEELEKATNNFEKARELGGGGHGTVYKGILLDLHVVAIKKSNAAIQREIDEFINEVAILSQINHRNVVKLFGCCLETEVPLLVYEFISNGTLYEHLHVEGPISLSWEDRLRIATETARALAYLHSAVSFPIIHRDIKSHNILLDGTLTTKVSDFGASRCVPVDQTGVTTVVQGTRGYLDPMCYYTGRLTEKSDVYSFGVILIELLTRKKPFSYTSSEGVSLVAHFTSLIAEGSLVDVLDPQVLEEGGREVEELAALAAVCVKLKPEERPTMRQVEMTLESLGASQEHAALHNIVARRSAETHVAVTYPTTEGRGKESSRQYSLEEEYLLSARYPR